MSLLKSEDVGNPISDRRFRRTRSAAGILGARGGTASQEPTLHALRAPAPEIEEATIAELQAAMAAGSLTALSLVRMYLARIRTLDRSGPHLNSILEVNPDAESIAM